MKRKAAKLLISDIIRLLRINDNIKSFSLLKDRAIKQHSDNYTGN